MENKPIVLEQYDNNHILYENFASKVEQLLCCILSEEGIKCNAITSRLKDKESLSEKIDRKQDKYQSLGDLTDIAGVRVITYYTKDVDKVAEIVEREFFIDRENSIDKRKVLEPDRFGYCSLHYVVKMKQNRLELPEYQMFSELKCEIQIRSVLQHAWAEIEHDLGYKNVNGIPKEIRRNFSRLAGLLEIADEEFQGIRSLLESYQEEAIVKMEHEELLDDEINVILLETIITTDKEFVELNNEILNMYCKNNKSYRISYSIEDYERSIDKLHWFNIYTISQLRDFIFKNKKYAIYIAHEFLLNPIKKRSIIIPQTISLFYLFYAELIDINYNTDKIMGYLSDFNIGLTTTAQNETLNKLLKIRKNLNISN